MEYTCVKRIECACEYCIGNKQVRDEIRQNKKNINKTQLLWNVSIVTIESNVGFLDD